MDKKQEENRNKFAVTWNAIKIKHFIFYISLLVMSCEVIAYMFAASIDYLSSIVSVVQPQLQDQLVMQI